MPEIDYVDEAKLNAVFEKASWDLTDGEVKYLLDTEKELWSSEKALHEAFPKAIGQTLILDVIRSEYPSVSLVAIDGEKGRNVTVKLWGDWLDELNQVLEQVTKYMKVRELLRNIDHKVTDERRRKYVKGEL
jgi:adenylate cyclase